MLHPSYADLINVVNSGVEEGEDPVVNSRYSIVMATSKRARQIIAGDEELVDGEESAYGLFIMTVDGETIDEADQEWWCITRGGERVDTGADTTPIADGDHFELTMSTY